MTPTLELLMARIDQLSATVEGTTGLIDRHERLLQAAEGSPLISRKLADQLYSPQVMQRELGAGGTSPLALSGLPGEAGQVQPALVPDLPKLPEPGDSSVRQGTVFTVGPTLYQRVGNTNRALTGGGGVAPVPTHALGSSNAPATSTTPGVITIEDSSSSLAGKPAAPTPGMFYHNSFFDRLWIYDGANWHGYNWSIGAGAQVSTSGPAPSGGLWQACDGSTVVCALENCTTGNLTATPAQATGGNNPTLQGGAGDTSQHAAVAPTWDAAAKTDTQSLSISVSTGLSVTTGTALTGVGTTVVTAVSDSPSGSASPNPHSHTLSNANAKINPPTDAAGLGLRVSMALWMRR